jgi:histidyl-tRNA synthetase
LKFKSIKGTRDILPEESYRWQALERELRSVMHLFNYKEIRTPAFEETALFARGIGELTDIVSKEMYTFVDRGGDRLTLKPEMTASVIRSYVQHNLGEQQPLTKVYYISPMFRQERPQAGRMRQFHQFGAEAIGGASADIDAEVIALSVEVYNRFGIKNISLKINSVGCEHCRPQYKELLKKYLKEKFDELSQESKQRFEQNPLRILDSKDEHDREITKDAPLMKDHLCPECDKHFSRLQSALKSLKVDFEVDGRIVRGLDYYTKTAYEIVSADLGSQDALVGGGRYDLLVKELGGKNTPAVGFAAGMERLMMVVDKQKSLDAVDVHPYIYFVAADEEGRRWIFEQAFALRRAGISCDLDMLDRSLKAQMREADRQRAEYVLVVGGNELKQQSVNLKNMKTGEQQSLAVPDVLRTLQNLPRRNEADETN